MQSLQPDPGQPLEGAASAPAFGALPLYFVENQGQTDERVAFYVPGKDTTLYFAAEGVTLALGMPTASAEAPVSALGGDAQDWSDLAGPPPTPPTTQRWAVKLDFVGGNPDSRPVGENKTETVFSYFTGQPDQWHAGLPTFAQVRYANLWPGVDAVYSGQTNRLKYEFVVQPGADPAQIQLAYRGASAVELTADGQLAVTTPAGGFLDAAPLAYQMVDGQPAQVALAYVLHAPVTDGPATIFSYSFEVGAYDHTLPLILDPAVLVYAGYIGGSGIDSGNGIAVDSDGNAYVTGFAGSDQTTFPINTGPDIVQNGSTDAFVAKVNAAGTTLIYAGYIGGQFGDQGYAIAVDSDGNAYVAGETNSTADTFPEVGGPDLSANGSTDAFVAKINATGTALVYAGFIGGEFVDTARGIAVDTDGNAYVTGSTSSTEATFPEVGGPDLTYNLGTSDAFVAKVNAAGTALVYAGYIGGSGIETSHGLAVDGDGNAYIVGYTASNQTTFPAVTGPDLTYNGGQDDAFVAKVNAAGTALVYAGYIGGSGTDFGFGIATDLDGNAYVTGYTTSSESSFPDLGGPDLVYNGGADAFVAKVNAGGTNLIYAGYIGGSLTEYGYGIAVDDDGNAYISGETNSTEATFPEIGGPDLSHNLGTDAFVAKVNAAGTALIYAGYIGGSGTDGSKSIAVDGLGAAYVTGYTDSTHTTFTVTTGPDLTYNGGIYDAFVVKVVHSGPSDFLYLPLVVR